MRNFYNDTKKTGLDDRSFLTIVYLLIESCSVVLHVSILHHDRDNHL